MNVLARYFPMRRRRGFTIVELLVAMALIMLIMAILAEAFTKSIQAFSDLKAVGDMDQKMRALIVILTRDLSDEHFATVSNTTNAPLTPTPLSQINPSAGPPAVPGQGFFAFSQSAGSISEGADLDNLPSYYNTTAILHFTVNRWRSWNNSVNIPTWRRENYFA